MGSQRRASLVAPLVAILGMLVLSSPAQAQVATESDGPQVDAGHTGYVYGAGVVPPLSAAWTINVGPYSVPTVAIDGGQVFVIESDGNHNDTINSIDLANGKTTWSAPVGPVSDGADAGVVVDGGRVFVGAIMAYDGSPGTDGGYVLSAWNEQTGAALWSDTLMAHDPGTFVAPVVSGGVLYAQDGLNAFAVAEANGSQIWDTVLNANSNKLLDSPDNSLAIAGNVAFIGATGCNTEEGLSTTSGAILWSENTNSCTGGGVALASVNTAGVWAPDSPQGNMPAAIYDSRSGAIVGGFPTGTPAFGYGEAVGLATQPGGYSGLPTLEAFDPASRSVLWSLSLQTGAAQNQSGSASLPLLADGFVFEATSPAYPVNNSAPPEVEALNPCSATLAWRASLPFQPNQAAANLAAGDGYLVVSSEEGELEAFRGSSMPPSSPPVCLGTASAATTDGVAPDSAIGAARPTPAQVRRALRRALAAEARGAAHMAALRGYRDDVRFAAPSAGRLLVRWIVREHGRRVTVARVAAGPRGRRTMMVRITLSRRGRRLLRSRGRLRVLTIWTFAPTGARATSLSRRITVTR